MENMKVILLYFFTKHAVMISILTCDSSWWRVLRSRQYIVKPLNSPSHLMSCHNILFEPDIPCDFEKCVLHSSHPATCSLADGEATSSVTDPWCHFPIPIPLRDSEFRFIYLRQTTGDMAAVCTQASIQIQPRTGLTITQQVHHSPLI